MISGSAYSLSRSWMKMLPTIALSNPVDMATLLQRVDCRQYITCSAFLHDVILSNAKAYNGARIVSRAYELLDAVHGMLSHMDPALVSLCEKIAAQGGPENIPDDLGTYTFSATPNVQLGSVTRASVRLHNVQPEVNLDQSYEALKRRWCRPCRKWSFQKI